MKPKQPSLIQFLTVCIAPAIVGMTAPSAEAATRIWDGGAATNILNNAVNWSDDLVPSAAGDVAQWNGTVPGPLTLTSTGAWTQTGGNGGGTSISVTSGQTAPLTISPTQNFGVGSTIDVEVGAGPVTISPTANMVFRGGNATITNASTVNPLTFGASIGNWNNGGGAGRTVTFGGAGNIQIDGNFVMGGAGDYTTLTKTGTGTLTLNGAQNGSLAGVGNTMATVVINQGTLKFANAAQLATAGNLGTFASTIAISGTLDWSSTATQILSGVISGNGTINQTAGNLTLTGANTFNGTTNITGGTLAVGGTGSLESSIIVNGPTAKFLYNSTTPSTQNIAVTLGTVGGTGTISAATVANNAAAGVANGNNNSATLTLDTLTFNGAGSINITEDGDTSSPGIIVSGPLVTTPANGQVTINATNSFWNSGTTYALVNTGSFGGALTNFTKGTIAGLTSRQSSTLVLNGTTIGLQIGGDSPRWSGLDNSNWVVGTTGPNGNWRLISGNVQTNYIQGDVVLFNDLATNTTVTISAANVSPAIVNFSNTKNYILNGAFGIATGTLNKDRTGNLTISTPNTYAGGTNLDLGTITLSGAGTLGATTGALNILDGTLNLGGTSQTVGSVVISGEGTIQNGDLTATGLAVTTLFGDANISADLDLGSGNLTKSDEGTLILSGTTSYSGTTTISGGILQLSGSGSLGSTSALTLSGGALDLGTANQATGPLVITAAPAFGDTITNGSLAPTSVTVTTTNNIETISTNLEGSTGITLTGGGGVLSLKGANTFTGPLNMTGPSTVAIDGGSNTGGGAITFNSFGTTFTVNSGSYFTSGITTNGLSEFRSVNLNGGVLESAGNLFADAVAISININGGTVKSGNASGISLFDYNNLVQVNGLGANFDTTIGNITVGNNSTMFATGNVPIPTVNLPKVNGTAGGIVTLLGGNSLIAGITNTGSLDIKDNSTWDLNGIASSVSGLTGNGTVTTTAGPTVLTLNTTAGPFTYSGTIAGGANLSLVKQGGGTQTLTGTNSYLGDTTVLGGVLDVTGNAIPNTGKLIINGGMVNVTGTEVVGSLVFGETQQASGTWGATGSGATNIDDTRFSGTGKIQVSAAAGYAGWAAANGLTAGSNDGLGQDPDFDGISNLLEYVLGGLPIGANSANTSILPVQTVDATNITLTFRRSDLSEADTTQVVQISTNLGTWTNFATVGATSAGPVTVTENSPTADLDTISVVIPRAGNAVGGKLFVRLQAVK